MRMKGLVVAGLLMLAAAPAASAQGVRFAPELAVGDDTDFGIGARVNFDLTSLFHTAGFFGTGEFIYFFPGNNVNYWEINGNMGYLIPNVHGNVKPYVLGGLNLGHASVDNCGFDGCSNTDLGANLGGGINIHTRGKLMPFLEAKVTLGGGDQFVFTGGLYF
jgi:hypothetical protein